jgi:hypothetical protein
VCTGPRTGRPAARSGRRPASARAPSTSPTRAPGQPFDTCPRAEHALDRGRAVQLGLPRGLERGTSRSWTCPSGRSLSSAARAPILHHARRGDASSHMPADRCCRQGGAGGQPNAACCGRPRPGCRRRRIRPYEGSIGGRAQWRSELVRRPSGGGADRGERWPTVLRARRNEEVAACMTGSRSAAMPAAEGTRARGRCCSAGVRSRSESSGVGSRSRSDPAAPRAAGSSRSAWRTAAAAAWHRSRTATSWAAHSGSSTAAPRAGPWCPIDAGWSRERLRRGAARWLQFRRGGWRLTFTGPISMS